MKLSDLEYAGETILPAPSILYRVQRQRSRPGTLAKGALRLPPWGSRCARFDLVELEVGYFAESGETAIYETLARREATFLAMSALAKRVLLTMRTVRPLPMLDLRSHVGAWPVLQSLRYECTQGLARDARELGYSGIIYRSAQHYGADCAALFGNAMEGLQLQSKEPLVRSGAHHRLAALAVRGSQVPLTP